MLNTLILIAVFLVGVFTMWASIHIGEREELRQMSPEEEAKYEIEPVYAVSEEGK